MDYVIMADRAAGRDIFLVLTQPVQCDLNAPSLLLGKHGSIYYTRSYYYSA
jgi:hypothetical protein